MYNVVVEQIYFTLYGAANCSTIMSLMKSLLSRCVCCCCRASTEYNHSAGMASVPPNRLDMIIFTI